MKLDELTINRLEIPFKISFSHASATRNITDSVIVVARSENHTGYGESCPRSYVTGESFESVSGFFNKHKLSIRESITDAITLKEWSDAHVDAIDENPSAWCAIELALLDLLARNNDCTVEGLLGLAELSGAFKYTAVMGDSSMESFEKLLEQYHAMGFTDFKLKLSGKLAHDKNKCDVLAEQVSNARIRLDANNLWQSAGDAIAYVQNLGFDFFALEEPLKVNDYGGLALIAEELGLKVILDESFIRYQQFEYILNKPSDWIINIRISKMGGLQRSIAIAEQARKANISCIVGAQVGETSLLTRAALTLVNDFRELILAQEGACGTYLLEHDVFYPALMFGKGGQIIQDQLIKLDSFGFGLKSTGAVDSHVGKG